MKATLPRHEGNEDAEASDIDEDISLDLSQDESAASDDSDSEDETSNGAEDKPFVSAFPAEEDQSDEMASEDDEDGFHFSEDSLIGSDEEMDLRIGGSEPEASDAEDKSSKPKANKRRKLKHLPTFATAEDYAALLGASDDEQ